MQLPLHGACLNRWLSWSASRETTAALQERERQHLFCGAIRPLPSVANFHCEPNRASTGCVTCGTSGKEKGSGICNVACLRCDGCALECLTGSIPNTPYRWTRRTPRTVTARQEDVAVTRRRDKAERAHHASDRRLVLECGHDQHAWCSNGSTCVVCT